jgi:hypothetical protein
MLVGGSLAQARERLQELLRNIVKHPEVDGSLAMELEQVFYVLRNYAYFVDFQRRELAELCQEMDAL